MKKIILTLGIALGVVMTSQSLEVYADSFSTDTLGGKILFHVSHFDIDRNLKDNGTQLDSLTAVIRQYSKSGNFPEVLITGGASPEGATGFNMSLSQKRADALISYFHAETGLPDSVMSHNFLGADWIGLKKAVENDSNVPLRKEVIKTLDRIIENCENTRINSTESSHLLRSIGKGEAYSYLYNMYFPDLRATYVRIISTNPYRPLEGLSPDGPFVQPPEFHFPVTIPIFQSYNQEYHKPFYMALKTNMLFDALLIPSISAEFYLGKNFSIVGNWDYGWWDKNATHYYWRHYGGDVAFRWWFGKAAHDKPLTGHHLGVYGGAFTFDFELGDKGLMGGRPGHSLWDRCLLNTGIEYGYSLPVARRLNIDFTLGIGYVQGHYIKYHPHNNSYIWDSLNKLRWFGPTKAEISLVWLIGRGNFNEKGGAR